MGDCMWKYKFDKECIVNTLTQLSVHYDQYDIESPYQITYFKDIDWKIIVPKTNKKSREVSLHNFSLFKDQIMINQHNPLYNNKIKKEQQPPLQANRNEKVLQELIPNLRVLAAQEENFRKECMATQDYINSFEKFSITQWKFDSVMDNLKWRYKLVVKELKFNQSKKCKMKSWKQLKLLRDMENYKKEHKHWEKETKEERIMLQKMSVNNFEEKLQYYSVRNVIKKEIWKLAMKDVKKLINPIKAKCAKQILFYYKFGSTNKKKKKNYINLISDETLIKLYELENSPTGTMNDDYKEGFRILRQYQIKEIFWRETNQSVTSNYRRKVWDAIHMTEAERKYNVSSGKLLNSRKTAGKIIKDNLDKETFKIFKIECKELKFFAMGDYMEKYK
jgi:hypothetical protein